MNQKFIETFIAIRELEAKRIRSLRDADSLATRGNDNAAWNKPHAVKKIPAWKLKKYQTANEFFADYPGVAKTPLGRLIKCADLVAVGLPKADIVRILSPL